MQLANITDIKILPNRQRQVFEPEAMQELVEAIAARGLYHAIVVRETELGLTLVAGERRLRAIQDMWMFGRKLIYNNIEIPEGKVPYVTLGDLPELAAEEAELDENLKRKDLTWQERAAAMSKLHALRGKQAQMEGRVHTVADTTMELKGVRDGRQYTDVRTNLMVAKHLDSPEIQKAKSAEEALKILKKKEEQDKFAALAAEATSAAAVKKPSHDHTAVNMDCLDWLKTCPSEKFDVILTDPPYGINADGHRSKPISQHGAGIVHDYDDSYESWKALMEKWCPESFRVTKPQAHAYVFCDIENFMELKRMMVLAGWYVFRTPLIRTKPGVSGRVPLPNEGPRRQWEAILYAIKGHKPVNSVQSDVISADMDDLYPHGAVKPVNLYRQLLERSVRPGDQVLDCFAGSGPIFPAGTQLMVKVTGIEKATAAFGMCIKRLKDLDESNTSDSLSDEIAIMLANQQKR